jgi:hypothetical protein
MNNLSLFDSAINTLSKTKNLSDIQVKYVKSPKNIVTKKIPIYVDDTCKEVLLKLSSLHSITVSDHIFAWYKVGSDIIPVGFNYPSMELDFPFKNKTSLDDRFISEEGYRILAIIDKSHLHNLIEEYDIKTLFYTTIQDYLDYLGLNYKKDITDHICLQSTKFVCKDLYSGKLVKYWPSLTEDQIYDVVNVSKDKLKLERKVVNHMIRQSDMLYSSFKVILPEDFDLQLLSLSNDEENNIVHLTRLFSDISLGEQSKLDLSIPFSKITLEDYTTRYCKLLKDAISINTFNNKNYVTVDVFNSWFKNQVTSLPSTTLRFMDEKNTVCFKLFGEGFSNAATLLIYSNGLTKLLLSGKSMSSSYVNWTASYANTFIEYLNKFKIFSDKPIKQLDPKYENSVSYTTIQFIYPIKNYKIEIFEQLIKNMNTFIRFNKIVGNKISCIYKKVNQYGQSISAVITSLEKSRRGLTRDEIISELEIMFNISHDEAMEEYDNYKSDPNSYFKGGDEGIEFVIDLIGTNVKVDVVGITGYGIMGRIYHLLNFLMDYYENYITNKKDPKKLISKNEDTLFEDINNEEIEQELAIQEQVAAIEGVIDEIFGPSSPTVLRLDESISDSELSGIESSDHKSPVPEPVEQGSVLTGRIDPEQVIQAEIDSEGSNGSTKSSKTVSVLRLSSDSSESSLAVSEDFSMDRIDDSASDGGGMCTGCKKINCKGGCRCPEYYSSLKSINQRGGYNVSRYYLNRLKKYDKEIFSKQDNIARKNSYPVMCGAQIGRQPVAITKQMLDKYNETGAGEGVTFSKAVNIQGRDPNIYYICPKYWDIKDEKPWDPTKIPEFNDFIVDNKMTTSQKQRTDNYILVRDERGYWDQSGNDVERYRIELLKGCHSSYDLPCCYAGSKKLVKGWKVDVLVNENGKFRWKSGGEVTGVSKYIVNVTIDGDNAGYPQSHVRRNRSSNTLVSSFPLDIDAYGYIHPIINSFINQNYDSDKFSGLIRKGVFRSNSKGEQSLLESLTEILADNSTKDVLCKNIITDLKTLYRENKAIIQSIADGGFINKFKMDIIEFPHNKAIQFLNYVKKIYPFVDKNIKRIQTARKNKNNKPLPPVELFIEILKKGSTNERLLLNNEINIFSSIVQFEKYIKDEYEFVTDEYLIPVISTIAKYPSLTLTKVYSNLSIVVFEKVNEDIIISPPLGGFNNMSDSMIILYKENRYSYEPILYRKWDTSIGNFIYTGIIYSLDESNKFYEENDNFKNINKIIQKKLDVYINKTNRVSKLIKLNDLELLMKENEIPIKAYVYDSYSKVIYIQTEKYVLIPIEPSGIREYMNLIYFPTILKKGYPNYDNVIDIFTIIDRLSGKNYLMNPSLSVVNVSKKKLKLVIKEFILECGAYTPVSEEEYDSKRFKEDVCIAESYSLIDKNIGLHENTFDKRVDYLNRNEYMKSIQKLFFQKVFLMLKEKPKLFKDIYKIKYHPIMLRQHKSEGIFELMDKDVRKLLSIADTEIDDHNLYEEKGLLLIRPFTDITGKDMNAELIYYKLSKLMIECLLNYSERDYERFLQLNINLSKLKSLLNENELLFSHQDVVNDYHLEYFVRTSKYIRNYILHNEPVKLSKLIQLHHMKANTIKSVQGEFTKQYPQILHKLFGRKIDLITYKKEDYSFTRVINMILNELYEDSEITLELIESLVTGISKEGLDNLTAYFKNIGICCVSKLQTKRLQHDIVVSYHRKYSELPALVFYETETAIVHVKNRKGNFTIKDIPEK